MNHFVLFYIVSLVVISHEFEIDTSEGNGPCGDYPTKPDFDASKFAGTWNELQTASTHVDNKCDKGIFTVISDREMLLTFSYKRKDKYNKNNVTLSASDPKEARFQTITSDSGRISNDFYIIDTDYDKYAVTVLCQNEIKEHFDLVKIWTKRNPINFRDEAIKLSVDAMKKLDKKFNIVYTDLYNTDHSKCP